MFTGIIQEIGSIIAVKSETGKEITVSCQQILDQLTIGDSIAVNGVCQTAITITERSFSFYSSTETLSLTNLSFLKKGDYVNLERPISLNSLLDGHLVQGHVDEIGIIKAFQKKQMEFHLTITATKKLLRYMIHKGSIAVDGVSLTINQLYNDSFVVTLISTTADKTVFQYKNVGDKVNLEVDFFAKYIEKFITNPASKNELTADFLAKHGF